MFDQETLDCITRVAQSNGIEPAALQAVCFVESAGQAFWTVDGKQVPAIRFEGHYFNKFLSGTALQSARAAGLANPRAGAVKNPPSWSGRYALLEKAEGIDKDAALKSISMGLGQVMGANYAEIGYSSVEAMWTDCCDSVEGQVRVMAAFICHHGLDKSLNAHDWAGFAKVYNGPAYKTNRYDQNMASAYKSLVGGTSADSVKESLRWVQTNLTKLGYDCGKADGINGPKTEAAVKEFQTNNGCVVDGKPGTVTVQAIREALIRQANASTKANTPKVAALMAAGSVGAGDVVHAVSAASNSATSIRGLLDNIGINGAVAAVIVACVAGFVIYKMLSRTDQTKAEGPAW